MYLYIKTIDATKLNKISKIILPGVHGKYKILPLHSQVPRDEQRKVFEPVPQGCTKVGY